MGKYKSSVHNALNLEAKANCWANTGLKEARRIGQNRTEQKRREQEAEMNLSKGCQNVSFKYKHVYFITFGRA